MLVLGRKVGDSIILGDDIKITILDYDKHYSCVRVGIEAPPNVKILREEIYLRVAKQPSAQAK